MARFVIVVPPDMTDTCAELSTALAGEDVCVIVDRRQTDRRRGQTSPMVERRRTDRRGTQGGSGRPGRLTGAWGAGSR